MSACRAPPMLDLPDLDKGLNLTKKSADLDNGLNLIKKSVTLGITE